MEPDSRRVYVFIVLGLIAAVVVGLGVWRMSTPSARYSNAANNLPTSTAAPEHTSTEKSTTSTSHKKPSREKPSPTKVFSDTRDADHKHPESTDPYLAPNAVTHRSATNRLVRQMAAASPHNRKSPLNPATRPRHRLSLRKSHLLSRARSAPRSLLMPQQRYAVQKRSRLTAHRRLKINPTPSQKQQNS